MSETYGYDEYNDSITPELHHSLRAGTRQSNGVLQVFEPMSMREENWVARTIKNALRAGESKSSHAVVDDTRHLGPDITGTLTADMGVKFQINNQSVMSGHLQVFKQGGDMSNTNLVVRRLTPQECELLMGWGAGWTAIGLEEDGTEVQMADSHRYKMCGNGVVANVSEWIGVRYLEAKFAKDAS